MSIMMPEADQAVLARRDEIVVATKVHGRMAPGPNGAGLSRKAIMTEIDHSLRRLGMDYVDLYQIHRWDPNTPIEETMEALHDVVKAGKARYLGASSMHAWQFAKAQAVARIEPWGFFIVLGLVLLGVVGTYWLRPLMDVGYVVLNFLLTPLAALLR